MAKELEANGIPTALIATLTSVAVMVGAPRIVKGAGITHPVGNPDLPPEAERTFRRLVVESAVQALATEVHAPRIFDWGGGVGEADPAPSLEHP